MTDEKDDIHSKKIDVWLKYEGDHLSSKEKILLLEKGITNVEARASQTLSSITLMVVVDRVLHQAKHLYPAISQVNIDSHFLNFSAMDKEKDANEKIAALTFILKELFRVLARLTSNILNNPLHNELKKVSSKDSGES